MTKQTAANNPFLSACKKLFNKPIYAAMVSLMNSGEETLAGREAACKAWLASRQLTTDPAAILAAMAA